MVTPKTLSQHLDPAQGPKRVLSLDGGGTLGVIEIAFLERIEEILRARAGDDPAFRLCQYFDLIGGTSTGALIATALALGYRASEVKDLYFKWARKIFRSHRFGIPLFSPRFSASGLKSVLTNIVGDRPLETPDLKTSLAIVLKRIDTGSPWILTNNPRSKYWEDPGSDEIAEEAQSYIGNRHYKLRDVLRASTAAPYYFAPQSIQVIPDAPPGLFVDGSVSPYNNPALLLLTVAGLEGYRFNWTMDPDQLLLISIGSGASRPEISANSGRQMTAIGLAAHALTSVIWDSQVQTLKTLQWLTMCRRPWPINSELGPVGRDRLPSDPFHRRELATFQRYDLVFDPGWLAEHAAAQLTDHQIARLDDFVNPAIMAEVYALAQTVAARQVTAEDFPEPFDLA